MNQVQTDGRPRRTSLFGRFSTLFSQMPQMDAAAKLLAFLYLFMQLLLIGMALWPTGLFLTVCRPAGATTWALTIIGAVLFFNYAYVIALLLLRAIIPKPKEGFYPMRANGRPPREGFIYLLNGFLCMTRFHTPWAWMFTSVIANTYPLQPIYRRLFGPDTPTIFIGDNCHFIDPCLVEAGKNVMLGSYSCIGCHIFDNRGLTVRKVKIGDHAIIGAFTDIMMADVGHHSIVAAHSWVTPGTVIKPYELWAGTPAKKIKDLTPPEGKGEHHSEAT